MNSLRRPEHVEPGHFVFYSSGILGDHISATAKILAPPKNGEIYLALGQIIYQGGNLSYLQSGRRQLAKFEEVYDLKSYLNNVLFHNGPAKVQLAWPVAVSLPGTEVSRDNVLTIPYGYVYQQGLGVHFWVNEKHGFLPYLLVRYVLDGEDSRLIWCNQSLLRS